MEKTANKGGARVLEAVTGGILGLGAGAGGAALLHRPKEPLDWRDRYGQIHTRQRTPKESEQKKRAILRAAAVAGLGGATISVGGGAALRALLTERERRDAPRMISEYLGGLKNLTKERKQILADILEKQKAEPERLKKGLTGELRKLQRENAERGAGQASKMLKKQERRHAELLNEAALARERRPWGGLPWSPSRGGPTEGGRIQWTKNKKTTHEGLLEDYYLKLKEKHDLPSMSGPGNRYDGEQFFTKLLEKKSAVTLDAFFRELSVLARA